MFDKKDVKIEAVMLDKRTPKADANILIALAKVHDECVNKKWDFTRVEEKVAPAKILVDAVAADSNRLKALFTIIGEGLSAHKPEAKKASDLIKELFFSGLKNKLRQESIRDRFNEIVDAEDIEQLDKGYPMDEFLKARLLTSSLVL